MEEEKETEPLVAAAKSIEETFLSTLDEKELMAYNIAKSHLGTLFSLDKSNAFLEWLKK